MEDRTADELMQLAVNKYNLLEQRNAMPTDNVDKIVALKATVNPATENAARGQRNNRNKVDDAWKQVPPTVSEQLTMTKQMNVQTYHYCAGHKAWVIHTPEQCHLKTPNPPTNTVPTAPQPVADRIVINRAYQAILHEDDSENDE
jgi:hypothetical protein